MSFRHSGMPAYLVSMRHDGELVDIAISSEFPISVLGHGRMVPGGRPTLDTQQDIVTSVRGPDYATAQRLLVHSIYRNQDLAWVFMEGTSLWRQLWGPGGLGYYGGPQ